MQKPQDSPWPERREKPATHMTFRTPGTAATAWRNSSRAAVVRFRVAPRASSTLQRRAPLSSVGRKLEGTRREKNQMPATKAASRSRVTRPWRTMSRTPRRYTRRTRSRVQLKGRKRRGAFPRGGRRIREQRAGERVMATKVDRHREMHMVAANCM